MPYEALQELAFAWLTCLIPPGSQFLLSFCILGPRHSSLSFEFGQLPSLIPTWICSSLRRQL